MPCGKPDEVQWHLAALRNVSQNFAQCVGTACGQEEAISCNGEKISNANTSILRCMGKIPF